MMMDSETSKSENNSTPRREFLDHPPILNEDGLVIDCVLEDYPDPPKGTVKTIMDQYGDLIDLVDVHERSLQMGYDVSFTPVPLPLNSWKAPGAFVPPIHKPKATQPVLRHRKNFKPGLLCPWKTQNPPYEHVPPELHYSPVPPDTVKYSPDTVVKDSDDKIMAMLEKMMAMLAKKDVNDAATRSDMDVEVNKCLAAIQSMVDDGFIEDCSPLWCYAVSLIKSDISRSIMVNLSTNLKRNAWLRAKFAQNEAQNNGVVS